MATELVDPLKLTLLLNDLEQEALSRDIPAHVPIGAVRRAMKYGHLDAEGTK